MNELESIITAYQKAKAIDEVSAAEKIDAIFALKKSLLSNNSDEVKEFNYSCLQDTSDWQVYVICRVALHKREGIEAFLLKKLPIEKDSHMLSDIIHTLGIIRSPFAYGLAAKNIDNKSSEVRHTCFYVIGWTGKAEDIEQLKQHLLNETEARLRITAGSAMRQIFWQMPETKKLVIQALKEAFYTEKDSEVLGWIISFLVTITVKNLGMREDKNDPYILIGDLDKAILKTKKYFDSYKE